jgi:hypothetical protein
MRLRVWGLTGVVALALTSALFAQIGIDIRIGTPPPALRIETPPPPPSPGHYWIPGHWRWEGGQHVWVAGHWEAARAGQVYVRAYWAKEGDAWVFHPGRWVKVVPPPDFVPVRVNMPPPLPRGAVE